MQVSELIELLQKQPPNSEVIVGGMHDRIHDVFVWRGEPRIVQAALPEFQNGYVFLEGIGMPYPDAFVVKEKEADEPQPGIFIEEEFEDDEFDPIDQLFDEDPDREFGV